MIQSCYRGRFFFTENPEILKMGSKLNLFYWDYVFFWNKYKFQTTTFKKDPTLIPFYVPLKKKLK